MANAKKKRAKKKVQESESEAKDLPKTGKKRARKVTRQTQVPGTERHHFPDLSQAAEKYQGLKTERMEVLEEEVKAKEEVMGLMKAHGLETYVDDELDLEVVLEVGKANVKVRKRKVPEEAE